MIDPSGWLALFTDGGVVGPNPSKLGGTWAWVAIGLDGVVLHKECGIIEPEDLSVELVTNNHSELFAAWRALEAVPLWWAGTLYTDSKVTLHRLTCGKGFKNVPNWLRLAVLERRRGHKYRVELVGGHPTRAELEVGVRERNGFKVSPFNVRCDELCTLRAKELIVGRGVVC